MERFARWFARLDRTTSTLGKLAALEEYFREASPDDAAGALFFLPGRRLERHVSPARLRAWLEDVSGMPGWR